ncbi:hypothetical protein BH20ACI4_BH20ACI4_29690 [soil metagenome]
MAIVQYIIYLLVGIFLLFVMGTYFSVAAGFTIFAFILVLLPLFLAGYVSGLSFFFPRIAALASIFLVLPFLIFAIYNIINKTPFSEPIVFIVPSFVVILISSFVFFQHKPSLWTSRKEKAAKFAAFISATLPALLATFFLISSLIKILGRFVK